ncbi:MAG: sulfotransferase family 2 domain-containing protein [Planctomycetota bacterium]|nr:sulfotransferase family 2 domain-containing protein [Planctomycetota bacterium]
MPTYAFVHIPKTGGTTLKHILRRNFRTRHFDGRLLDYQPTLFANRKLIGAAEYSHLGWIGKRVRSFAGHGIRPYSDLADAAPQLQYYTFLRDPMKRTISAFASQMADALRADELPQSCRELRAQFLQLVPTWNNKQTRMLAGIPDADLAIETLETRVRFVGLLESFDESLVMLRRWMQPFHLDISYATRNISAQRMSRTRGNTSTTEQRQLTQHFVGSLTDDAELMEHLDAETREDQRLYAHARDVVYQRERRNYGDHLPADVNRFQAAQANLAQAPRGSFTAAAYRNLVLKRVIPYVLRKAA